MGPTLKPKMSLLRNMKKKEDASWVLEGIVGYLRSPGWNVPIMNFFDDNCGCFDNKEENKLEYTDIHLKYKSLVENLLSQYMQELSITEDVFALACKQHSSTVCGVEGMFEYLWAADDFILFRRLMTNHNLEIEMQAMSLLQMDDVLEPSSSKASASTNDDPRFDEEKDYKKIIEKSQEDYSGLVRSAQLFEAKEAQDLKQAIEFSKMEMERLNAQAEEEKRMLEEAIRLSLLCCSPEETTAAIPLSTSVTAHPVPCFSSATSSSSTAKPMKKETQKSKSATSVKQSLPPLRHISNAEAALDWIANAQTENTPGAVQDLSGTSAKSEVVFPSAPRGIDPSKLAERQQYLKSQRDKIVGLKKKQREEELKRYQDANGEANSAHKPTEHRGSSAVQSSSDGDKIMNARRALAERLKKEVIQKKS